MDKSVQQSPQASNGVEARQSRLRVKQACIPCKDRKRKCDGETPCSTCTRYEYTCYYDEQPRKRRRKTAPQAMSSQDSSPGNDHTARNHRTPVTSTQTDTLPQEATIADRKRWKEANSGSAFASLLGQKLDAGRASEQQLLAWNIGVSDELSGIHSAATRILSLEKMQALAQIYFETVHQAFGFLIKENFDSMVTERWSKGDVGDVRDPVICGVAALGSLFSGNSRSPLQGALVECAKTTLEAVDVLSFPTYDQAAGWLLRTMFLRCTARPHVTWIASNIMLNTIETVMISEPDVKPTLSNGPEPEVYSRNRVIWLGKLFNTFISNEYGRSRVQLKVDMPLIPATGDHTSDLFRLFQISETLDPSETHQAADFEHGIACIARLESQFDGLTLSRANAAFAFYRRLRLVSSVVQQETVDQILSLGASGLDAAKRMASKRQPWWHVANVPFQFICVLLVMDTKDSLAFIGRAMATLQAVSQCFATKSIANSVAAAQKLIKLSKQRKLDEVVLLGEGLNGSQQANDEPVQMTPTAFNDMGIPWQTTQDFGIDFAAMDWDPFLSMDIPIFDGLGLPIVTDPSFQGS